MDGGRLGGGSDGEIERGGAGGREEEWLGSRREDEGGRGICTRINVHWCEYIYICIYIYV